MKKFQYVGVICLSILMTVGYFVQNNNSDQRLASNTHMSDTFQDVFLTIFNLEKSRNKNYCANSVIQSYQHQQNQFSHKSDLKDLKVKLISLYNTRKISEQEFLKFKVALKNEMLKSKIKSMRDIEKPKFDHKLKSLSKIYSSEVLNQNFDDRIHFANPCLEKEYAIRLSLLNLQGIEDSQKRNALLSQAYKEGFLDLKMYSYLLKINLNFKKNQIATNI